MIDKIRWGILGPGKISRKFAGDLLLNDSVMIQAVASRSKERAIAFGNEFKIPLVYSNYEEMIRDKQIDIVYIGTPHSFHLEHTLLCLENQVPVLCEKPAGLNYREVLLMTEASRQNSTFFMEALWTRFLPSMEMVLNIVESGEMGDVLEVEAEFCFTAPIDPKGRLYDLSLGGGSILDIGIYPAFLAYQLLGKPLEISASGQRHASGADQTCSMVFSYDKKKSASLHCSIIYDSQMPSRINMSKGYILMQPRWHESASITIIKAGDEPKTILCPPIGKGFSHEIYECHECLRSNKIQSPHWSHQNSLDLIHILDEVRRQVGVIYPGRDL